MTGPDVAWIVPIPGGGWAVNVTVLPDDAFRTPTPPATDQENVSPPTELFHASNPFATKACVSRGRRLTLSGEREIRVRGPGETITVPLSPVVGPLAA